MIKKIRKTLKTAPTKNYFCLLDTSLNEHEFENKDNKFIFESSVLISERRHELNKKSSFPGSTAPSNTIYQSDWNGCVSYIPTVEGFLINISMVKNYDGEDYATKEEQEILSKYVGWGGIPEAFDSRIDNWHNEYEELKINSNVIGIDTNKIFFLIFDTLSYL